MRMMLKSDQVDRLELQKRLRNAVINCNDRCLYHSAKWAAELLHSVSESIATLDEDVTEDHDHVFVEQWDQDASETRLQQAESTRYLMAKSFFDCREFDRCAATLMPSLLPTQPVPRASPISVTTSKQVLSRKSLFLALYAKVLAGEKRKEEESEMILGPSDGPVTPNEELSKILGILEQFFDDRGHGATAVSDGFLEYLYGVALMKTKSMDNARMWLERSVLANPYLWSAWQDLCSCTESVQQRDSYEGWANGRDRIAPLLYQVYSTQEFSQPDDSILEILDELDAIFPHSSFLQTQRALLLNNSKVFDEATRLFQLIMKEHPYRLDSLDKYSDVLFVQEQRSQLAYLASVASATDKFRPETCCIIGNYYSLVGNHEEAVMYFRRALTLDRSYVSAWILMGHAYLELRGVRAAIESYRRALDANTKDARAWHGLGRAYESLDMQSYALYYYQRAAALQPLEPKMWQAVGAAFRQCGKLDNAIRAYKRALGTTGPGTSEKSLIRVDGDPMGNAIGGAYDDVIFYSIAELYEEAGDDDEAAAYMELCLAQEEGPDEADIALGVPSGNVPSGIGVTMSTGKARLWLARYCFARQDWQRVTDLANELCQDGVEVEEAKALKRDVRSRIEAEEELGRSHVV